jgi:membrane protease YdiL (CAAX protease family)
MVEAAGDHQDAGPPIDPDLRREIGDPVSVTFAATVVYVPALVAGLLLTVLWQRTVPGPRASLRDVAADVAIGLGVAAGMILITWSLARWVRPLRQLEKEFQRVLGPLTRGRIAALALLSGIAEELVFRGTLQPWLGYVPASVIFGCLHFVPDLVFLPWTIFALAAGFLFGALFEWRESLVAPIVAHVVVNGVNMLLIVSGKRIRPSTRDPSAAS